jgi:hypothetical protein
MNSDHPKTEKEKELADDARLMKWWKAWHREQRDEALAKHPSLIELFRMFANIQHVAPVQLVGFVQSINWADVYYAIRLTVLHEINNAITDFRVERDMEPIDDNLPGEPETPFRQLKALLFPPNGAPTGA